MEAKIALLYGTLWSNGQFLSFTARYVKNDGCLLNSKYNTWSSLIATSQLCVDRAAHFATNLAGFFVILLSFHFFFFFTLPRNDAVIVL